MPEYKEAVLAARGSTVYLYGDGDILIADTDNGVIVIHEDEQRALLAILKAKFE